FPSQYFVLIPRVSMPVTSFIKAVARIGTAVDVLPAFGRPPITLKSPLAAKMRPLISIIGSMGWMLLACVILVERISSRVYSVLTEGWSFACSSLIDFSTWLRSMLLLCYGFFDFIYTLRNYFENFEYINGI